MSVARLRIRDAGVATTLQDTGRRGLAHLGISPAGAVDPATAAAVNRAVGNSPDRTLIETAGGLTVIAEGRLTVACSRSVAPTALGDGDSYTVAPDPHRQWHYLAVCGGLLADPVMGSTSTDTLSGLGPPPVATGDLIAVGSDRASMPVADLHVAGGPVDAVRILPGPRLGWFDDGAWDMLLSARWQVTASSRVGLRLAGPALSRRVTEELPSEGLVRGAIQVPPDGALLVMAADHPTTGGYPVIAVLDAASCGTITRVPIGATVRLTG